MKYTVGYKDLLLNTLLDTIKRENRRTIDGIDIINYKRELIKIINKFNLPIEFISIQDSNSFLKEIETYVYMTNQNSKLVFTLLPWIGEKELENNIKNTILANMGFMYNITEELLRCKRDIQSIQHLKNIEKEVNVDLIKITAENISFFEQKKIEEECKLKKIKKNLNLHD